ncbi:hypothetical protein V1264_005760 [Littorina saxatilis]|uniref:Uncharacterized protein n=1 Tax=Littorina saxatilis TaxID=31220 RepID=A0AAN9B0H7_9CAEN
MRMVLAREVALETSSEPMSALVYELSVDRSQSRETVSVCVRMETEKHSHETEFKIEIDVAEEPPLAWCMTQQQPQSVERSQARQTVSGCDRMEEEERTVKIEVETERDTQEPLLGRQSVPQCTTQQHSQEPEVKIEIDIAEEPPLAWCMTQQHSHVGTGKMSGRGRPRRPNQGNRPARLQEELPVSGARAKRQRRSETTAATAQVPSSNRDSQGAWFDGAHDATRQEPELRQQLVRTGRGRPRRTNQGNRPARLQEELPVSGARAKRQRRTATRAATAQVPSSNKDSQGAWFDRAHDATRQEPESRQQQGTDEGLFNRVRSLKEWANQARQDSEARIRALESALASQSASQKGQALDALSITVPHEIKERIVLNKFVDLQVLSANSFLDRPEEKAHNCRPTLLFLSSPHQLELTTSPLPATTVFRSI